MKTFIPLILVSMLLAVTGCKSSDYQTRIDPPDAFSPVFLGYKDVPTNKVMVIAVDPVGQWAYGYEHSCATLEEAAEKAAIKCDQERLKFGVFNKARLFAINDEIVYYDQAK
jgi:hypothetical protein